MPIVISAFKMLQVSRQGFSEVEVDRRLQRRPERPKTWRFLLAKYKYLTTKDHPLAKAVESRKLAKRATTVAQKDKAVEAEN
jgi:hypothetical protein